MSQISLKSLSGITSITTPAGVDDVFTVHSNDTTERFRVDSIGNLNITGNVSVAGVTTFSNNVRLLERDRLQLGNSQEFQIYYGLRDYNNTDDHAVIRNSTGNLYIQEDSHIVFETPAGSDMASMSAGDAVKLFFNGTQKFQTTNTGITVAGTVNATSFVGSGAQLTGIVGGKFGGGATGIQTVGNVGVQTANMTAPDLVGAASSLVGLYIGDGSLLFSNNLSRTGGYYITTGVNALNAGPVTLNSALTLNGTWVIV